MKLPQLLIWTAPLLLATGCIHPDNHYARRTPVFYYYEPTVTPAKGAELLTPTGDSAGRLYPRTEIAANPLSIVVPGQDANPDDLAAADSIRRALQEHPAVLTAPGGVTITVRNGRVVLAGVVASNADRDDLISTVKKIPGLAVIENQLRVNPNW